MTNAQLKYGDVPKWLKGSDSKSDRSVLAGAGVQIPASPPAKAPMRMGAFLFCKPFYMPFCIPYNAFFAAPFGIYLFLLYNTNMIKRSDLKVLQGGMHSKEECEKGFLSAYVTNTRLMGNMGLIIKWKLLNCDECETLSQLFFIQTSEPQIKEYHSTWGSANRLSFSAGEDVLRCLGGEKKVLSEKEACALVAYYHKLTTSCNRRVLGDSKEYSFILDKAISLSDSEKEHLISCICEPITSVYQSINYFLMRVFEKDYIGASYLCDEHFGGSLCGDFCDIPIGVLDHNTIKGENGKFICKSIVHGENDRNYFCISEIGLTDLKVTHAKTLNYFEISVAEKHMILSKKEYITVFDLLTEDANINEIIFKIPFPQTSTPHANGSLHLVFKSVNDHVDSAVYSLTDDMVGTYFVTYTGQIIIQAFSYKDAKKLEDALMKNEIASSLILVGKYKFKNPVLSSFIDSGYLDFESFLDGDEPVF